MLYFSSVIVKDLDANATGFSLPGEPCANTDPIARFDASQVKINVV